MNLHYYLRLELTQPSMSGNAFSITQASADQAFVASLSAKDALVWADAKMRAVEEYFTSLNGLRNSLVPAYNLPVEILVEIFWLIASHPRHAEKRRKKHIKQWLDITHVCNLWRTVAISQPKLWSFVDLSHFPSARVFLERSHDCPIEIFTTWKASRAESDSISTIPAFMREIKDIIGAHVQHVTYVDVLLSEKNVRALLDCFTVPMPLLRVLHIRNSRESSPDTTFTPVIGDRPPQLTSLHLQFVIISWDSPIYRGLIHLRLTQNTLETSLAMDAFIAMLESCPQLQTLELRSAGPQLPAGTSTAPNAFKRIQLPQLRRIYIDLPAVDITHLLSHLDIPFTTTSVLKFQEEELNNVLPPHLLPYLESPNTCNLTAEYSARDRAGNVLLPVTLDLIAPHDSMFAALCETFKGIEWTMKSFKFACHGKVQFSKDEWSSLFVTTCRIKTLTISDSPDITGFMGALTSKLCPELKDIEFISIPFNAVLENVLVECVVHRKYQNLAINQVGFDEVEGLSEELEERLLHSRAVTSVLRTEPADPQP